MSTADRQDALQRLATPIQFVKGIGPQLAPLLERLELRTAADLLFFFPRDYHDASRVLAIHELEEDQPASVCGVVEEIELRNTGTGRTLLGVLVRQDREHLRACGSISLICANGSGEDPACCCPERLGSTAAGGKWSIRG